jgi:hypothetical protein
MATTRDGVKVLVAQTNQDILSENLIVREELPLWKPVIIGVLTLLFLTVTAYAVSIMSINDVYAQDVLKTATQSIREATKIAESWTETPTLTMTPTDTATPTVTPTATNTPLPTNTTQPTKRRVIVVSTVSPDDKAEMSVTLPTSTFYTGGILAPDVNIRPGRVVDIKPITRSETISNVQYITVTATPEYWEAWHTVDIAVRNAPERDGSSIVCHYVISGVGFTRDVKMKMANHEHDFRVGERESQQVRSDGGYCFYISQGQTMWDCSIYPGNSAVLPLLVGSNQEIAVTWEYGQTELIRNPAPQSTGPGVDNGRSPPQNETAPQPTAPPATNTPAPSATPAVTWTPHIVYVVVTNTPAYRTATPQPTAPPASTPTNIVYPPTFTPPPNFNTPPPPLNPVSDSVTVNTARCMVYLPVILKGL